MMLSSAAASLLVFPNGLRISEETSRIKTALMRGVFGFGMNARMPLMIAMIATMLPSSHAIHSRADSGFLGFQNFNCEPAHLMRLLARLRLGRRKPRTGRFSVNSGYDSQNAASTHSVDAGPPMASPRGRLPLARLRFHASLECRADPPLRRMRGSLAAGRRGTLASALG
jgi:hypothetical protein